MMFYRILEQTKTSVESEQQGKETEKHSRN